LRARRGMAAAAAAAFALSVAFAAGDAFVPLMLTAVRGRTIAEAGVLLTFMTVAWAGGSWWQSRVAVRMSATTLVVIGGSALAIGLASLLFALADAPLVVPYLGWTIAGVGMGIAWPTIPLSVMDASPRGEEASELSSTLLMDTLGIALGAGLAGASIALARPTGAPLRIGLAGAFGIGLLACALLLIVAPRLPEPDRGPR
jgi:MFS family permease